MLDELGEHRGAFVGLFVATGVAMLGLSILLPILPTYANTLGATGLVLGAIMSSFAVSRGVFAPYVGRVSDRYGRRNLLVFGLAFYACLALAYTLAGTPLSLGVVRFTQGFASVLVTPLAQSYVGDITPEGSEGSITNLFYVSLFGGIAVGPTLGGYLNDHYGIAAPFYAMALLAVVAAVLVYVLVPELDPDVRDVQDVPDFRDAARAAWADYELRGILAYIAARGFYRWGFNSFFPVLMTSAAFGFDGTTIGLLLSLYMAIGGVLQIPFGRVSDDYSEYRIHFIVGGSLVSALAMMAVPLATTLPLLVAVIVAMGVFSSVSRTSAIAIRTERGRIHGMGLVTGAFTASVSAGQVFGPLGFGAMQDTIGLADAFYVGGVVGLFGTAGALYYLLRGRRQARERVRDAAAD
ncbi:MAG: MFS transporter [Halarchaeum sp.]